MRAALRGAVGALPVSKAGHTLAAMSLVPTGVVFSMEQLRATGRLREGFVLDLNADVVHAPLSDTQLEDLVEQVTKRVAERLSAARGRSFSEVVKQVPANAPPPAAPAAAATPSAPSRSAPASTLQQNVHLMNPTPAQATELEQQRKRAEQLEREARKAVALANRPGIITSTKPKGVAKPKAPSVHGMQTRRSAPEAGTATPAPATTPASRPIVRISPKDPDVVEIPNPATAPTSTQQPTAQEQADMPRAAAIVQPDYRPLVPSGWMQVRNGKARPLYTYNLTAGPSGHAGAGRRV